MESVVFAIGHSAKHFRDSPRARVTDFSTAPVYLRQKGFEENKNLILTAEPPQLWNLLYHGRIDFVLSNLEIGAYEISSAGLDPDRAITELNIAPLSAELHVATGMMTELSEVEAIKEALNTLKENGEYQRIMRKWGLKPFATAP